MAKKATALDVLGQLSIEDVEQEIAQLEQELAEFAAGIEKKLSALRVIHKALRLQRDGKPARAARGSRKAGKAPRPPKDEEPGQPPAASPSTATGTQSSVDRVREHLRLYGRQTPAEVAKAIQPPIAYQTVYNILANPANKFEKDGLGRYSA